MVIKPVIKLESASTSRDWPPIHRPLTYEIRWLSDGSESNLESVSSQSIDNFNCPTESTNLDELNLWDMHPWSFSMDNSEDKNNESN